MNLTPGIFEPGSGDLLRFYVMILAMIIVTGGLVHSQTKRLDIAARTSFPFFTG